MRRHCKNNYCQALETHFVQDFNRGDIICTNCGRVQDEKILDMTSEVNNFDEDKDESRTQRIDELSGEMRTFISKKKFSRDDGSKGLINENTKDLNHKRLEFARIQLTDIGSHLRLNPKIIETARMTYKQYLDLKGKNVSKAESFFVAFLYIACEQNKVSRSIADLAKEMNLEIRAISKHYKNISSVINHTQITRVLPQHLVESICGKLNMPYLTNLAASIAEKAENELTGRKPKSIAAASIYMVVIEAKINCNLNMIANASGVSSSTIATIFKLMEPNLPELLPEDFQKHLDYINQQAEK